MGKGKMCAQCGHAAISAYRNGKRTSPHLVNAWLRGGETKIAVKVTGEELADSIAKAEIARLPCGVIHDAGRTQVDPGTTTVGYIGPCPIDEVDAITGSFSLL